MGNDFAPIIIFCYNRPQHLASLISSLQNNPEAKVSDLYVFSDAALSTIHTDNVDTVRKIIRATTGFKQVHVFEQAQNLGLAKSIISGVTQVFEVHESAIVLEDDLIVSSCFLKFMNLTLKTYKHNTRVFSISGYTPPINIADNYKTDYDIYFSYRFNSWGWATWKDRWIDVDWDILDFNSFIHDKKQRNTFNQGGKDSSMMLLNQQKGLINSWAIRFYYHCYKHHGLTVYPVMSHIINRGADGSGTHVRKTNKYKNKLIQETKEYKLPNTISLNSAITKAMQIFYKQSIIRKCINAYKLHTYLIFSNKQ